MENENRVRPAPAIAVESVPPEISGLFFSLTPDHVLDAVEQSGYRATGLCYALNSLENRVYEVELEDRTRLVGKFYRPGRWSVEAIREEHVLLQALADEEIPVVVPVAFPDGDTVHQTADGILFTLFPRCGGRSPEELGLSEYRELGRALARTHNIGAKLTLGHRPSISPATYGTEATEILVRSGQMTDGLAASLNDAAQRLVTIAEERYRGVDLLPIHGDCHRGNLLRREGQGFFLLDFDDMGVGPAVQDLWLLLPGRRRESHAEIEAFIEGYEIFREFDRTALRLIEALRALRYLRYAAWIANRWADPAFVRAFPDWGSERYWQTLVVDLHDQLLVLQEEDVQPVGWH